jgi:hypothetical protein
MAAHNISDDTSCGFGSSTAANGATIGDNVDPLLDPSGLQNNGGPTDTIALQSASPAIDAIPLASCPAIDQRSVTRPDAGETACDIGAVEVQDFASMTAQLRLKPSIGAFNVKAGFALDPASLGIDPLVQTVTLQLGSYSAIVPPGSFHRRRNGVWVFSGTVSGVSLHFVIKPARSGGYLLTSRGQGADLAGIVNPVTVTLTIGANTGTTQVTADFH